jgi:hypothetical protein
MVSFMIFTALFQNILDTPSYYKRWRCSTGEFIWTVTNFSRTNMSQEKKHSVTSHVASLFTYRTQTDKVGCSEAHVVSVRWLRNLQENVLIIFHFITSFAKVKDKSWKGRKIVIKCYKN